MKHDKVKEQRTNAVTAVGRKATRREQHREREGAEGWGVTWCFSFLSKLAFVLDTLLTLLLLR